MGKLFKNTIYLYLLQFSNYLFSLITLPLITRVLGPETYGKIGFGMAFSVYFLLIIDFGFRLSGTRRISDARDDASEIQHIVSCISMAKVGLGIVLAICLGISSLIFDVIRDNSLLLYLYLLYAIFSSLIPDYLYRGLENMKIITFRAVLMKGIFTCLIFVFLRHKSQYFLIPVFQMIGEITALAWIYYDIRYNLKMSLHIPRLADVAGHVKESFQYFISRISSTVYNVANTTILGIMYPGGSIVGYYTSADRIRSVGCSAMTPIADSFYPYMNRTKDFNKLFKVTLLIEIPVFVGCGVIWWWAPEICDMLFGDAFSGSAVLLRWMLPVVAITLPSYMFGFPALTALGKAKWANYSVELASVNQVLGIILLACFFEITAVNLCILTFISEVLVLMVRLIIIIKNKHKIIR